MENKQITREINFHNIWSLAHFTSHDMKLTQEGGADIQVCMLQSGFLTSTSTLVYSPVIVDYLPLPTCLGLKTYPFTKIECISKETNMNNI